MSATMPTSPLVSVIIPARNEFPQIVFTVQSIIHDLETFLKPHEFEVIIVANCCDDSLYPRKGTGGTVDYLFGRGAYWNRVIRVVYDPLAGNHSTRNYGALLARGKYIFFSDAHMAYKVGYHQRMIRAINKTGGIVHGTIGWLGAYPPGKSMGYQYTMKLGEEIKGTWNNYKLTDDYFYIPLQGHCCLGMLREQFLDFDGYPKYHRCYGGGEFYLDIKWWMFGSTVAVDPQAIAYHLCAPRGYSYHYEEEYIHNVLMIGHCMDMWGWVDRAYINWCRHHDKKVMDRLWKESKKEAAEDKKYIKERAGYTFNDLIVERPWDGLNDRLYGNHNSSMMIFQDTIVPSFKGTPAEEMYNDPQYRQKELEEFIYSKLSDKVYKKGWKPKEEDPRIIQPDHPSLWKN